MRETDKYVQSCKQNLEARIDPGPVVSRNPVFSAAHMRFQLSRRISAVHQGGIGVVRELVRCLGIAELLNDRFHFFKIHQPYHESDHILNLAYNFHSGGECLEDLELLRNNEAFLDAIGAERIPDPTTAGDFLRRFSHDDNMTLIDVMNEINRRAWRRTSGTKRPVAILDVDSIVTETYGECKRGMDISYKGVWGFHPLVITEATTGMHVCGALRPGNAASQRDAGVHIDSAVTAVQDDFERVMLRGDSAFSLTEKFDDWTNRGVEFCFGYDSDKKMIGMAENLPDSRWKRISSQGPPSEISEKDRKVIQREYRNLHTQKEYLAEFEHRPAKCGMAYRVLVLKKILKVTKGQLRLADDVRYLFYITNITARSAHEILQFIRDRCDHENKLEQLKYLHALKTPTADFQANWAFMLVGMISWNLKSALGLFWVDRAHGEKIIHMEFKRYLNTIVYFPCQILTTGRQTVYRFLNWNSWLPDMMTTLELLGATAHQT